MLILPNINMFLLKYARRGKQGKPNKKAKRAILQRLCAIKVKCDRQGAQLLDKKGQNVVDANANIN